MTDSKNREFARDDAAGETGQRFDQAASQPIEGTSSQRDEDKPHRAASRKSDFATRFVVGLIYVAVSSVCLLVNNLTTLIYLCAVAGMCAFEFYRMMRHDDKIVNEVLGIAAAVSYPAAVYFCGAAGIMVASALFMTALVIWYVFWPKARVMDLCLSFFGAVYLGLSLSCLMLIREAVGQPWGGVVLLVIFMSVWFNDVGAYLVGSRFGRHKMAPLISPKKTWEGFAGGLVVSVIFWVALSFVPGVTMSIPQAVAFGAICGAMADIGDLVESRIKRNVGVKDSGTIMPGHGGMFDRSDSLFTAAVAAIALLYLGGCIPLGF